MSPDLSEIAEILREDGFLGLWRKTVSYAQRLVTNRLLPLRGYYSLSVNGISTRFSAPDYVVVSRNRDRFQSEQEELQSVLSELESDDIFYDVGANTGLYSLFAAQQCPDGQVVSFEPYPPNIELLERDIKKNGIKNIDIMEIALSNESGEIRFDQPDSADAGYGSSTITSEVSSSGTLVSTNSGDELISSGRIPRPNVIKIDVEGSEPLVINGLSQALSDSECRLIFCEVHLPGSSDRPSVDEFGSSLGELKKQLESFGFDVSIEHERGQELFLKGTKPNS